MAAGNVMGTCIHALPKECIANALSLTSPKDAGRSSVVSSNFHSAAQFDVVWERFLPPDYRDIISRAANGADLLAFTSKKDLYFHLCHHPAIIDGGVVSFSLEKGSGKKCYMIAARSLHISWDDNTNFWRWISLSNSRFPEVAELVYVWWLEIRGKISTKMLSPDTNYAAYLVYTVNSELHGFESLPVDASVGINGQEIETRKLYLDPNDVERPMNRTGSRRTGNVVNSSSVNNGEYSKRRGDNWMEVELGDIFINAGEEDDYVEMSLIEVKGGYPKGGIIVEGIEIRPKAENVMGTGIHALPEECIANALSLTSPKDACRSSVVSPNFHSAAQFDGVWEWLLPPDYRNLISRAGNSTDLLAFTSKKDLYFHLCHHPAIIDGGTMSFSLEKGSGKKCCMIAARSLHISWGDNTVYWRWISLPNSRFPEVAELLYVYWLEIRGKVSTKMPSPGTNYAAYLVYTVNSKLQGFESLPVDTSVGINGQKIETRKLYLDNNGKYSKRRDFHQRW